MSAMCLRVALVAAMVAVGCVTMTPLEQVPPQNACPSRNSCRERSATNFIKDPCYCDDLCNTYADCCYDSEFRNASLQKTYNANDFRCRHLGGEEVHVKIKCKAGWTDAEVEDLCVGGGVHTDPVSYLPVTSNVTGYTYPNYYCAICNEDILDLRIWNGKIECNLPSLSHIDMNNLVFRNNTWGVLWGNSEPQNFSTCSLSPEIPQDIKNLTRSCSLSIGTCGEDWQGEMVASQCQSYTAVVYYNNESYRNPHCALCNKKKDNYSCIAPFDAAPRFPFNRPFALIFDFTDPSKSNLVGSSSPCNATQIWDPFFKRCRSIVCPKPDQYYWYGKCVTLSDVNSSERSELTAAPTTTDGAAATNNNNNSNSSNSNITNNSSNRTDSSNSHNSSGSSNSTTTVTASNTTASVTNDSSTSNNTTAVTITNNTTTVTTNNNNTTTPDTLSSTVPPTTNAPESDPSTTDSLGTFPEDKHPILFPEDPTEPPTTPSEDETPITPSEEDILTTLPPSTPSPDASTHASLPPSTSSSPDASTHASPTPPLHPDTDSTQTADAALSANSSSEFAECYKVILSEGEFVALPNGTVYVAEYDRFYSPGEYARMSKGLLVCRPNTTSSRKFSAALGWVSLAGLGLSCTSLLLHLAAFALLPELRNLSGRNLASLCLALLAAYITFLVNTLMQPDPTGCVTLAAAMYYFFVTSFTWMNVIAFDVWYTFSLTQRQLRVSNGDQWHRFVAYSLYGWLLPAAATLVLLLVDQLEPRGVPEEFLPHLGRTWCWFSHRKALLAFFALPMVIIIVVNCVFFVCTAAIITQTGSTAAAASARGNHPRGQYKMYLRLAVLMGFTWVSGIAAGYLDLEALWYVFVILNTLQGVFIFLAFTFRTRVWQGVGATCRKLLQRGLSKMTRRSSLHDIRAFELSHTPEGTSASHSSPNTSLEAC